MDEKEKTPTRWGDASHLLAMDIVGLMLEGKVNAPTRNKILFILGHMTAISALQDMQVPFDALKFNEQRAGLGSLKGGEDSHEEHNAAGEAGIQ